MRILFIQDNGYNESLGIISISAVLKAGGHDCDILIASEENNLLEKIKEYKPDMVAFSLMTGVHEWGIEFARRLKEEMDVLTVFGGAHFTIFPETIEEDGVDVICAGEGEYPMLELADALEKGRDTTKIKNLWVKKGKKIYRNPVRDLIQDFDKLPMPDRDLYYKYKFIRDLPMKRFITGMGCPYNCTFCHNHLFKKIYEGKGKYVRKRSIESVIKEIKYVKDNTPLKIVHFSDDTFVIDRDWLYGFLERYRKEINVPFTCNVRIDLVNDEMVRKMRQAQWIGITFGVEGGDENIRNTIMKKNLKDKTIIENSKIFKKYNIKILTSNIIGVPGETPESVYKTLEINRKIKVDFTRIHILLVWPKLEIAKIAQELGLLPKDFNIKNYRQQRREPLLMAKYRNEFRNLCVFFNLMAKYPRLDFIFKRLMRLPNNWLFNQVRKYDIYEEARFYKLFNFNGLRYYYHTFKTVNKI